MTVATEVSAAISRLADGTERPDDLRLVATYDGYWIAALEREDGFEAVVQPDDDGRLFFPFFTSREALERARPAMAHLDGLRTTRCTGAQLCDVVLEEAARDTVVGVVVDHAGPAEPRAFAVGAMELWRVALRPG